jgi:pimeloyl-ACP methyl ester carboxylesterase
MPTELPIPTHNAGAMHAVEFGSDNARPPIVLLHGLTFDRRIWAPIIEALQARDPARRVIAFDLPGHGESPACPPHDLPRICELVHDALETLGTRTPLIVGHSMAGALASMYAARYPTVGVVSVDQLPFVREFAGLVRSLAPQLRSAAFAQVWADVFATSFHTELLPEPAERLVKQNGRPDQDLVLSYWRMLLETPVDEVETLIEGVLHEIARQQIPYVLVLGSRIPAAARDALEQRMPMLRIVEWPGTGHFPHLAHPAEFAELLTGIAAPADIGSPAG